MNRKKAGVLLIGGGAIMVSLLVGLNNNSSSATDVSVTVPGVPSNCATSVHYMAYDAQQHGNFGATLKDYASVTSAVVDYKAGMCSDPLFAAVKMESAAHGLELNGAATEQLATTYARNHKKWASDVTSYMAKAKFTLASYNVSYETLGQVIGANRSIQPKLIRASENVSLGQSLDVTINGWKINNRVVCHFQESGPHIPNVPTKVTPNVPNSSTPPAIPPSTPHTVCNLPPMQFHHVVNCRYVKDAQSWECQQNAGPGCPPNLAHQDPQIPRGNQASATQQPNTVPSSAPPVQSTTALQPSAAPAPTSGGYAGGNGPNPIQSSGTPGNASGGAPTTPVVQPS
jgi:hypothetical protein